MGRCDSIVQIQPITPELHVQVIVSLSILINHGIVHVLKCFRLPVSSRGEAAVRYGELHMHGTELWFAGNSENCKPKNLVN